MKFIQGKALKLEIGQDLSFDGRCAANAPASSSKEALAGATILPFS